MLKKTLNFQIEKIILRSYIYIARVVKLYAMCVRLSNGKLDRWNEKLSG